MTIFHLLLVIYIMEDLIIHPHQFLTLMDREEDLVVVEVDLDGVVLPLLYFLLVEDMVLEEE